MALLEQTTPDFRLDWDHLNPADRMTARQALDRGYAALQDNRRAFFARV
jgi:PIN domain nuclease of toxin-antitoxin system